MKKLVGAVLVVLLIWSLCMAIPVRATEGTEFTAPTLETEPVSTEETALATEEPTLPTEETILETRPQVLPQKPVPKRRRLPSRRSRNFPGKPEKSPLVLITAFGFGRMAP